MGSKQSKPVKSQPLDVRKEVEQRQIVFRACDNCQHKIEFLGLSYSLPKDGSITLNDLQPSTQYTYKWTTLEANAQEWSDSGQGSFKTQDIIPQVHAISGPKEAIFSVKKEDIEVLKAIEVELFDNQGSSIRKFELTAFVRTFRVFQLEPASQYIYTFKPKTSSAFQKGEFYTKKPHAFANLFQKDETFIKTRIEQLKKEFTQLRTPTGSGDINLLVVGRPGAGKSSCLNTIISSLKGKYVSLANPGNNTESFTKEITYIKLGEELSINLVDIFGFEAAKKDDHLKIIDKLIKGEISTGFLQSSLSEVENVPHKKEIKRQVNGFLIIFDQQSLDNDTIQKDLLMYFEKIRQTNLPYIVMLTQVDKPFGEEVLKTQEIFEHPKVAERLEKAKQKLALDSIYPQVNYTCHYNDRDYYKECLTLELVSLLADAIITKLENEQYKNQF